MSKSAPVALPVAITTVETDAASKVRALDAAMNSAFLERREEIRCALIALVAGEHILLLGDPGTAKSALARTLCKALDNATYFETLLARTSKPEQLFGPFDLAGLKASPSRYERNVDGYLPTADVGFLDEIFKCNSAILNSLLTILNEGTFKQGTKNLKCPLRLVIGASNELPDANATDSLDALYDRFLLRRWVPAELKDRDNMRALLSMSSEPAVGVKLSDTELAAIRGLAARVFLPDDVISAVLDLKDALASGPGITASPRRWRKCMKLVRASAAIAGRTVATTEDLKVLVDALWRKPEERAAVKGQVQEVVNPVVGDALKILDAASEAFDGTDLSDTSASGVSVLSLLNKALKDMTGAVRAMSDDAAVQEIADQIHELQTRVQVAAAASFQ